MTKVKRTRCTPEEDLEARQLLSEVFKDIQERFSEGVQVEPSEFLDVIKEALVNSRRTAQIIYELKSVRENVPEVTQTLKNHIKIYTLAIEILTEVGPGWVDWCWEKDQ
jgi:hypothetical protein